MTTINIYGSSDDCIEVDGAISEEFSLQNDEKGDLLAFSDGTVLRIAFTSEGIWRITPVKRGRGTYTKFFEATSYDDDKYSDVVNLEADWSTGWVVHGIAIA